MSAQKIELLPLAVHPNVDLCTTPRLRRYNAERGPVAPEHQRKSSEVVVPSRARALRFELSAAGGAGATLYAAIEAADWRIAGWRLVRQFRPVRAGVPSSEQTLIGAHEYLNPGMPLVREQPDQYGVAWVEPYGVVRASWFIELDADGLDVFAFGITVEALGSNLILMPPQQT